MSQVVTKFPSTNQTIVVGWNNPANAYAEDGVNADASPPNEATEPEQKYGGWNFTAGDIPEGSTITKVEMGTKHYEVDPTGYYQYTRLKHVNSGGSSAIYELTRRTSLTWDWVDITSRESFWDLNKLNSADVRIISKIIAQGGGGGCYPENAYFLGKDENGWVLRTPKEIKEGDRLLVWKEPEGLDFAEVGRAEAYEGIQEYITVFLPKLKFANRRAEGEFFDFQPHVTVTTKHPLRVFKKEGKVRGREFAQTLLSAGELHQRIVGGEKFWIGTLWKGESLMALPIERVDYHQKPGKVFKIIMKDTNAKHLFADCFTSEEIEYLGKFGYGLRQIADLMPLLSQMYKLTSYVDALALRVTYVPPIAGQFHSLGEGLTNSTIFT